MSKPRMTTLIFAAFLAVSALLLLAFTLGESRAVAAGVESNPQVEDQQAYAAASEVYLPVSLLNYPWRSPFGAESNDRWYPGSNIYNKGVELNLKWARLGQRVSWRKLQPAEGDPIDWTKLAKFEQELRALKAAG
ncbi:MAG TPA: hypothetical protein VI776_01135, partial [Anaerolineales bacterium]|nr:hypothetical protein [Anaerolineales bacterium]